MSTTIEAFGSTSLIEDGSYYFLQPNGGSAVVLSYGGSPVVVGQFTFGPWVPIAAEQTASGVSGGLEADGRRSVSGVEHRQ